MLNFVRSKNTIQWLPFVPPFFPHSFVVIPVSLDVISPEMLELLRDFGRSNLLQPEDEDPRDDDAQDVPATAGLGAVRLRPIAPGAGTFACA